ncbi:MAG: class I SAM-dependent methyltransferase [Phycisphaerae bacterium]|jgi:SAM-dependent methyltransferase
MTADGVPATCPACGGGDFRPWHNVRGTQLVRCSDCGLGTWAWAGVDLAAIYDADYWRSTETGRGYADYFSLAQAMTRTHGQRLSWIARQLRRGASPAGAQLRLLDAGCGPGYFVAAAQQAGFVASGVEISTYAIEFARRELGQDVRQGHICRADLPDGPFDVVTMWDVLEHLPDPSAALTAVADVLRPGGLLLLSTGDAASLAARLSRSRWHLFTLPEHLWFFNPASLRHLLRGAGLEPAGQRYEICWYTLRYLVERLEAMAGGRRYVSPRLGPLGRLVLPMTLADVVTVHAVKPLSDAAGA